MIWFLSKPAALILTAALALTVAANSYACDCIGESTVSGSIKGSDIVAVGTVISAGIDTLTDAEMISIFHPDSSKMKLFPYTMTAAKYKIVVGQLFKGKTSTDTITVYTGRGGGDCGYHFKIGDKYIIYGTTKTYFGQVNNKFNFPSGQNIFWTHTCSRTTLYNDKEYNDIKTATKTK